MKYRKKPVVVDAIKLDSTNLEEIRKMCGDKIRISIVDTAWEVGKGAPQILTVVHTLTGDVYPEVGDYIMKGVNCEIYPCKPDIFKKTYEPV